MNIDGCQGATPGLSASRFVRDLSSFADKLQQISSTSCTAIRELPNYCLYLNRSCARIRTIQDTEIYLSRGCKTGVRFCCAHRLVGLWARSGSTPASLCAVCSIWTEVVSNYFCLFVFVNFTWRKVVTICTASLTFNNSTFCPHSCIYVFCVDLRTNSHYFPIQH